MANAHEQLTQAEMAVLSAIRKVCLSGHGEVTIKVHRGQVTDIVKNETEKIHIEAA